MEVTTSRFTNYLNLNETVVIFLLLLVYFIRRNYISIYKIKKEGNDNIYIVIKKK